MEQNINLTKNQNFYNNVDCCYHIHIELGPGLLESVYEEVLFSNLR